MGASGRPALEYGLEDHVDHLTAWLDLVLAGGLQRDLAACPGAVLGPDTVEWARREWPALTVVDVALAGTSFRRTSRPTSPAPGGRGLSNCPPKTYRVDRLDPMASLRGSADRHDRLNDLRTATIRRAASLVSSFDGIVEATTDVATDDEHDPEGHTIAWERQQIAALLDEARTALAEIAAAEQRLETGRYGTCTICGLPITHERLDALPATATCVACAR